MRQTLKKPGATRRAGRKTPARSNTRAKSQSARVQTKREQRRLKARAKFQRRLNKAKLRVNRSNCGTLAAFTLIWTLGIFASYCWALSDSAQDSWVPATLITAEAVIGAIMLVLFSSRMTDKLCKASTIIRRRAEEVRQLTRMLSKTSAAMLITDAHGRATWVNEAFIKLTGLNELQIRNTVFMEYLLGEKTCDCAVEKIYQHMEEATEVCLDIAIYSTEQKRTWVQLELNPVFSDQGLLDQFVVVMTEITELKSREKSLIHRVTHDQLTRIPNRCMFKDKLELAVNDFRKGGVNFGVLFLDLDGFKPINDTHGHEVGDQVLKIAAKRMEACIREEDVAARMGGDEFTILLNDLHTTADAIHTAYRVLQHIERPIQTTAGKVEISTSIGIALSDQADLTAEGIMESADQAMYHAKRAGKKRAFIIQHAGNKTAIRSAKFPTSNNRTAIS